MSKQTDDELAELKRELADQKARVAELEEKAKPPKPSVPKPYEPIDWTARMSMPPSALKAMVDAVPDGFMRDVVRDNRAPTTPATIPSSSQQPTSARGSNVPGGGTGWVDPVSLGPSPHARYVDAQLDAQDNKDRAELIRQHAQLEAMEKFSEQGEKLQKLADQLAEQNKENAEPGK